MTGGGGAPPPPPVQSSLVDDYNDQVEVLQERYGSSVEVARLQKVRQRGLLLRFCSWPNFAPVVMPYCDVVALTSYEIIDGQRSQPNVLGYVCQQALLEVLGERAGERLIPVGHVVIEAPLDGDAQFALLRRVHPDLKAAAVDLLGEA